MKVAEALAHSRVPSGPTPGPAAAAVPPAPAGMKQCSDPTHRPYDARKTECPHHARERKQRFRANQAKERQGEVPA